MTERKTPWPEYQTPRDVLERRYREVVAMADAHGLTFDTALDGTDWPLEERVEVLAYRRDEYGQ